jgi:hypothetical protein
MIEGNKVQPLDLAGRVLGRETMVEVRKNLMRPRGWKILDRWAVNSPKELKMLEERGRMVLISKVMTQEEVENQALAEADLLDGVDEAELLSQLGVNTHLA